MKQQRQWSRHISKNFRIHIEDELLKIYNWVGFNIHSLSLDSSFCGDNNEDSTRGEAEKKKGTRKDQPVKLRIQGRLFAV